MPDKYTVRGLVIIRLIAAALDRDELHLRVIDLLSGIVDAEWERLGIDREYPMLARFGERALYRTYADLAGAGLMHDFTPVRDLAARLKLPVASVYVLHCMFQATKAEGDAIAISGLIERFGDQPYNDFSSALNRLVRAGLATWDKTTGQDSTAALTLRAYGVVTEVEALAPLMALMERVDLTYQISGRGLAVARALTDDWRGWSLPPAE